MNLNKSPKSQVRGLKLWNVFKSKIGFENHHHFALRTPHSELSGSRGRLSEDGVTMIEFMIVIAITGIVMSAIASITLQSIKAYANQNARIQIESQAQNFMFILTEKLRQAQPGTMSISNYTGENNESMIIFTEVNQSSPVSIYLKTTTGTGGKVLDRRILMFEPFTSISGGVTTTSYSTGGQVLASNVVSLYMTFPQISDNSRVQVSLSQEKYPFAKQPAVDLQTTQVIYVRN